MITPSDAIGMGRGYLAEVVPDFYALNPVVDEILLVPKRGDQANGEWRVFFTAKIEEKPKKRPETLADVIRTRKIDKMVALDAEEGALIAVRNGSSFQFAK